MKEIIASDLILIRSLCNWEITQEQFKNKTAFKADFNQLNFLLDKTEPFCSVENDNQHFNSIFWNLPTALTKNEEKEIYQKFLLIKWHHEHEEIVGTFQIVFNQDKKNIQILKNAIKGMPDYLQADDFKYSYIRKIIYAIGAQPEPHNIEALEKLARETDDEQIIDLTRHQIEKRKKLGRWEAAKNAQ